MLKNDRWFVLLFMAILLYLGAKALSPVPVPRESSCKIAEGTLLEITTVGEDLFFLLKDDQTRYYINEGLNKGLDPGQLSQTLTGQFISIKYPRYWTPVDPLKRKRHISKLTHGDHTLYSELREDKIPGTRDK